MALGDNVNSQLGILNGRVNDLWSMANEFKIERAREMERLRGRKPVRFRAFAVGSNPFTLGGDQPGTSGTPFTLGPEQGYVWSLRDLVIEGLTSGATPDVINIRLQNAAGPLFWQLNGNSFGVTFGRGDKVLFGGESLFFASVGTFASTATIKVFGMAENLPAERIGELY